MLTNYFKTAFRNFYRHLAYTTLNALGLTIGLSTVVMIYLWIADELRFDSHYKDAGRIYGVMFNDRLSDGTIRTGASTPGPLAEAMMTEFVQVESAARADFGTKRLLRFGNKSLLQNGVWADSTLFDVFSLNVLSGNKQNPLSDKNSIVLTARTAQKFFPNEDALGKTFRVDEKFDMQVTAIVEDQPLTTELQFDFLMPYAVAIDESPWLAAWYNSNDKTYVKLKQGASLSAVNKRLETYLSSKCKDCKGTIWLQSLSDKRLHSNYENGKIAGGRIDYIRIFGIAAMFILGIACINFMNLATARAATRGREIGIRKVVGAQRTSLIVQFIGEAVLISSASMLLALAFVQLALPWFNLFTEKEVFLDFTNLNFIGALLLIVLLTGLLAGSYPALFLSSFKPAAVLKGNTQSLFTGESLRKTLVVIQFTLSVVMIISSIVIYRQVQFIKNTNLGFNRENVLTFALRENASKNKEGFRQMALSNASISDITFAGQNPFAIGWSTTTVTWPGKEDGAITPIKIICTDKEFIPTLKIKLLEGRNFNDNLSDSTSYIINEAAAKLIGAREPVGSTLEFWEVKGTIIGVVEDFHNQNLSRAIEPQVILCNPDQTWTVFARVDGDVSSAIAHMEKLYKQFDPNFPFDYSFLDTEFQSQYKLENTIEKVGLYFTIVAVFISCLGLFGLASFTAERRTKEIGIRKVLGATEASLVRLLCSDFTKLVILALLVACPVSFFMMEKFLAGYAYHTEMSWTIFAIASSLILVSALLTVIYQSAKAAYANPVKSLRSE